MGGLFEASYKNVSYYKRRWINKRRRRARRQRHASINTLHRTCSLLSLAPFSNIAWLRGSARFMYLGCGQAFYDMPIPGIGRIVKFAEEPDCLVRGYDDIKKKGWMSRLCVKQNIMRRIIRLRKRWKPPWRRWTKRRRLERLDASFASYKVKFQDMNYVGHVVKTRESTKNRRGGRHRDSYT